MQVDLFSPKGFLQVGGIILIVVGVLGYVGVIGPAASQSLFGDAWWFDNAENIAHLVLGIAGLGASYVLDKALQKTLVMLLGILGVGVGVYNFVSPTLLGANLEVPLDTVLHLAVGGWALYASMVAKK